uniref:Integrase catalytic domain-containing protein n=1 Tax=Ganoderma boninense TaxID=34458 RepID=A0A5K1K4S6_9APHY|nr:Uncharacterized protein [Ganoderma boninense]
MPVRGDRTCPKFDEADPRSLNRYFTDLDALFAKHAVPNATADDWRDRKELAVRYLPDYVEQAWMYLETYTEVTKTFEQFKTEVYTLYPGVKRSREFTTDDLRRIVREQRAEKRISDINDYSRFYVKALPMLKNLLAKSRITHTEANSFLAEVLEANLEPVITNRLYQAFQNRDADTPYTLEQFHAATTYVLQHRNDDADAIFRAARTSETADQAKDAAPPAPPPTIKIEEAASVAELLSKAITEAVARALPQPLPMRERPPQMGRGYGPPIGRRPGERTEHPRCYYCGKEGCTTRSCPDAAEDIIAGKVRRDAAGQIVMYDGAPIPFNLPGRNMRERVNTYCDMHRDTAPRPAENLLLEIPDGASTITVSEAAEINFLGSVEKTEVVDSEELYHINALNAIRERRRYKFDGVMIPPRQKQKPLPASESAPSSSGTQPTREKPKPSEPEKPQEDPPATDPGHKGKGKERVVPAVEPRPVAPQAEHPYARVQPVDNAPLPARGPFRGVAPPKDDPAYRVQMAGQDPTADGRIFDQAMTALPFVSLTLGDLLNVAPGVRKKLHDATGLRRVPFKETDPQAPAIQTREKPVVPNPGQSKESEPAKTPGILKLKEPLRPRATSPVQAAYIEEMRDEDADFADPAPANAPSLPEARPLDSSPSSPLVGAQASLFATEAREPSPVTGCERKPVRVLWCLINHAKVEECILDGGCQIVAMSEECSRRNKIRVDPFVGLDVQSANGSLDNAIGLGRDVPFQLTPEITVYLQVFVMRNAAYDVLLGRPFETLLNLTTENLGPDSHFVTVDCPNAKTSARIPTSAREELFEDGDTMAFVVEHDARTGEIEMLAYTMLPDTSDSSITHAYLMACDDFALPGTARSELINSFSLEAFMASPGVVPAFSPAQTFAFNPQDLKTAPDSPVSVPIWSLAASNTSRSQGSEALADVYLKTKKKYKPVALKTRPLLADLPAKFRIERKIIGDPLARMPALNPHPPSVFVPGERYTQERRDEMRARHADFLWPAELDLLDDLIKNQERAFAWTDAERGSFRRDFFPPVEIPTVAHKPWVLRNIPIPPGLHDEICEQIRKKIAAGVYEPSNSCYRSRWFPVAKKDGKIRLVHSLEPLNAVTIQHSGVPPIPEYIIEQFAARPCVGAFDLFVGYDEREIAPSSRDYTTFQTPFGAHRLTTLPMGWTNSVPIFHDDVTYILHDEIPEHCAVYIDDVMQKGPKTDYRLPDGTYETIPENPGIRRFVWEHLVTSNRIIRRIAYAGGTFSGPKAWPCVEERVLVGSRVTPIGRLPERERVAVIQNWSPCETLTDVRAFLGTVGVARIFIKDFAKRAHALTQLTRKGVPFEFGPDQLAAFQDLKTALLDCPALRPLDYESDEPIILGVDTSHIAVGYLLCQQAENDAKKRFYNRFGSITLNSRESRFSQPKLELYGLFRALSALKLRLLGVRKLIVETDAGYIKGMLANPDLQPSAAINRWIMGILTFHFELVHIPGKKHAPDGLSRRVPRPGDPEEPPTDDFDNWLDNIYSFVHLVNEPPRLLDSDLTAQESDSIELFALGIVPQARPPDLAIPPYSDFPRTEHARRAEEQLQRVRAFLDDPKRPPDLDDRRWKLFVRFATKFLLDHRGGLWRRNTGGAHRLVLAEDKRPSALAELHDRVGHRGLFATRAFVFERFWWPQMGSDVDWYVRTCHLCQVRRVVRINIPPIVPEPSAPMVRIHADSMHMPGRYKYFAHARCATTSWAEGRALVSETARTLGEWIFQDIICRWNALQEIITDNGAPWVAACTYLEEKYHLHHIRISGYNSKANGVIERPHFNVRDALFKATDGDGPHWHQAVHTVLWADLTGSQPILPLDFKEATYLVGPPDALLSTEDLIANRAIALQKRAEDVQRLRSTVYETRLREAAEFEARHRATVKDFNPPAGTLVLIKNSAIEKSLNRKMRPRYLGPYLVVSRNRGGAYIVAEIDGAVLDRPIAAFRVLPYLARKDPIAFTPEDLDVDSRRIRELENTTELGDGALDFEADEDGA